MADVFISHAQADEPIVRKLADDLQSAGLTVWKDEEVFRPGQNWAKAISEAIDTSKYVIILLSDASSKSEWVRSEAALALSKEDKLVVPVRLSQNADVPIFLRSKNILDLSDNAKYSRNINRLIDTFRLSEKPDRESDDKIRLQIAEFERKTLALEKEHLQVEHRSTNWNVISATTSAGVTFATIALLTVFLYSEFEGKFSGLLSGVGIGVAASVVIPYLSRLITRVVSEREEVDK